LASIYGVPDDDLLRQSSYSLHACPYLGEEGLQVIQISCILSVVSMQPLPTMEGEVDRENLWFVVEKSGIDDTELTGYVDDLHADL
jgi:hypothetical protein